MKPVIKLHPTVGAYGDAEVVMVAVINISTSHYKQREADWSKTYDFWLYNL